MSDQMMSDKKRKKLKFERVKTADDFIKKWYRWWGIRSEEEMRQDLIGIVRHNKVGTRLNKTDLVRIK